MTRVECTFPVLAFSHQDVIVKPWRPWRPWRWVKIELEAATGEQLDLEGVQRWICETIDRQRDFWEEREAISETKAKILAAADIPSLIGIMGSFA